MGSDPSSNSADPEPLLGAGEVFASPFFGPKPGLLRNPWMISDLNHLDVFESIWGSILLVIF
jgi:hypothetical protein